jgi:hypothetical protein
MRRSLLLVLAAGLLLGVLPAASSAAPAPCHGPQASAFSGCLTAASATTQSLEATFAGASERVGGVGEKLSRLAGEVPGRRAGAGLIALIWAMTLLGAATVVVLLRRTPPHMAAHSQA